ncbi:MAG: 3-methyl-2-oxobutanoate hydroxymethyltransferase [Opitutae bacterium]|nr:3-methyl-2-oxobutanoate hydroxymethyltransferase [Opitutae bacterium]MBT5381148.1 3-methyl-2-oxobutanoate hydroxymethyltransferase [Opitutae bacterium]MBT5692592.1 3-methyl-2-oxobutanoate hydroxymethyltransferase [Opitutae bacterium]MBT6462223.1 3-methyl-2-oxobutanoate hydroxymethyltransferase [Opitutae bacterium]MBT6957640.1 3-methyl-2-oxobutanoate hydroxymethyltransferase [Opitutae bacterium]
MKKTVQTIRKAKGKNQITAITAYDTLMADFASRANMDILLVGDSVGTTALGFQTTVEVTMEMMIHHCAAVRRANPSCLLVVDVPFAQAHLSPEESLKQCVRLIQEGGAEAVKIEGDSALEGTIAHIVTSGIPVMGHIGLLPQRINDLGGYRKFGRTEKERDSLLRDAKAMEDAGCFALVGEMIEPQTTAKITSSTSIPIIGIGSGNDCDGQILVCTDMLGYQSEFNPSFVKTYANLEETILSAFKQYGKEVREGTFPK